MKFTKYCRKLNFIKNRDYDFGLIFYKLNELEEKDGKYSYYIVRDKDPLAGGFAPGSGDRRGSGSCYWYERIKNGW